MISSETGPSVAMAVLCQAVELREDGSMDVLGIVEGVVLEPAPPSDQDPLGLQPAAVLPLRLLVTLRAGPLRGAQRVRIASHYPAGNAGPSTEIDVEFSDQRPGATVNVPLEVRVHEAGTYRFAVLLGERPMASVPLRVLFTRDDVM